MGTNVTVSLVGKQGPKGADGAPGAPGQSVSLGTGDIGGTLSAPTVTGSHFLAPLPVAQGGTGGNSYAQLDAFRRIFYPWEFPVTAYGAKVDGQVVHDAAMTAGSAVVTSASGRFKSTDVGKAVAVKGAASAAVTTLVTTILSYQSATQVTLAAVNSSGSNQTGLEMVWGTDDTAAVNSAVTAGHSYATTVSATDPTAGSGLYKVRFPPGLCVIAGAPTKGGATAGNAQIPLYLRGTTLNKVKPEFEGYGDASSFGHWGQTDLERCSTIYSMGVYASPAAQTADQNANGQCSVIGGPTVPYGYGINSGGAVVTNVRPVLRNLSIRTTHSAQGLTFSAFDFFGCAGAGLHNVCIGTAGQVGDGDYSFTAGFANGASIGGLMPCPGNNDDLHCSNISIQGGYTWGIWLGEHFVTDRIGVLYCWSALCPVGSYGNSVGATHAINVGQASVEACDHTVCVIGVGSNGQGPWLYGVIDSEGTPSFIDRFAPVSGQGLNALLGEVYLCGILPDTTVIDMQAPTGLRIRNAMQGRPHRVLTAGTYTLNVLDENVYLDATSGPVTVNLISAAWTPNEFYFERLDNVTSNAVTIHAAGSELIDGAASFTLATQYARASVTPRRVSGTWGWARKS